MLPEPPIDLTARMGARDDDIPFDAFMRGLHDMTLTALDTAKIRPRRKVEQVNLVMKQVENEFGDPQDISFSVRGYEIAIYCGFAWLNMTYEQADSLRLFLDRALSEVEKRADASYGDPSLPNHGLMHLKRRQRKHRRWLLKRNRIRHDTHGT